MRHLSLLLLLLLTIVSTSVLEVNAVCSAAHKIRLQACIRVVEQARKHKGYALDKAQCYDGDPLHDDCNELKQALQPAIGDISHAVHYDRYIPAVCHFTLVDLKDPKYADDIDCLRNYDSRPICLFIHGVGGKLNKKGVNWRDVHGAAIKYHLLTGYHDYWGNIGKHVDPFCRSIFLRVDSTSYTDLVDGTEHKRGWDDPDLQNDVCGAIELLQPKVIVTHSMGGLVVAAAIARQVNGCNNIGTQANQIKWIANQNPFRGAGVAEWLRKKVCRAKPKTKVEGLTKAVRKGNCHATQDKALIPSYDSLRPQYTNQFNNGQIIPQFDCTGKGQTCITLISVAQAHVSAGICGRKATALRAKKGTIQGRALGTGKTAAERYLIRDSNGETNSDGMVETASCMLNNNYKPNPFSLWYVSKANHNEGTCRNGDGTDDGSKPCLFLRNAIAHMVDVSTVIKLRALKKTKEKKKKPSKKVSITPMDFIPLGVDDDMVDLSDEDILTIDSESEQEPQEKVEKKKKTEKEKGMTLNKIKKLNGVKFGF